MVAYQLEQLSLTGKTGKLLAIKGIDRSSWRSQLTFCILISLIPAKLYAQKNEPPQEWLAQTSLIELKEILVPLALHLGETAEDFAKLEQTHLGESGLYKYQKALDQAHKPLEHIERQIWQIEGRWLNQAAEIRFQAATFVESQSDQFDQQTQERIRMLKKQHDVYERIKTEEGHRFAKRINRRIDLLKQLHWVRNQRQVLKRLDQNWQISQYQFLANLSLALGELSAQVHLLKIQLKHLSVQIRTIQEKKTLSLTLNQQQQLINMHLPQMNQSFAQMNAALRQMQIDSLDAIKLKEVHLEK